MYLKLLWLYGFFADIESFCADRSDIYKLEKHTNSMTWHDILTVYPASLVLKAHICKVGDIYVNTKATNYVLRSYPCYMLSPVHYV